MFVPPEPKTSTERVLAAGVVPLYQATPSQLALWELGQKRHHKALASVAKSIDQTEPQTACDVSLLRGWEHSKAFQEDLKLRHIADENKKLIGHLAHIVTHPSEISKQASQPRPKIPQRGREAEKRRIKEVNRENELLVKRLLNVKPSLNRQADERDYARHRKCMERLKKIPAPGETRRIRPYQRLASLPEYSEPLAVQDQEHEATFVPSAGTRRTLPPLSKQLSSSRSAPAITNHAAHGGSPGGGRCSLPPISSPAAPMEEPQAQASSSSGRPARRGSGAASVSRVSAASVSMESFRMRSPLTVGGESMEESPPDTPMIAQSIIAGVMPEPTRDGSDPLPDGSGRSPDDSGLAPAAEGHEHAA